MFTLIFTKKAVILSVSEVQLIEYQIRWRNPFLFYWGSKSHKTDKQQRLRKYHSNLAKLHPKSWSNLKLIQFIWCHLERFPILSRIKDIWISGHLRELFINVFINERKTLLRTRTKAWVCFKRWPRKNISKKRNNYTWKAFTATLHIHHSSTTMSETRKKPRNTLSHLISTDFDIQHLVNSVNKSQTEILQL